MLRLLNAAASPVRFLQQANGKKSVQFRTSESDEGEGISAVNEDGAKDGQDSKKPVSVGAAGVPIGSPEDSANLISKLFFWYVNPVLVEGTKKHLDVDDLWGITEVSIS